MVNTELDNIDKVLSDNYNILNIVVNTEPIYTSEVLQTYYNILNIVVNTEHSVDRVR